MFFLNVTFILAWFVMNMFNYQTILNHNEVLKSLDLQTSSNLFTHWFLGYLFKFSNIGQSLALKISPPWNSNIVCCFKYCQNFSFLQKKCICYYAIQNTYALSIRLHYQCSFEYMMYWSFSNVLNPNSNVYICKFVG
jgi:hypothetical protein